MLMKLKRTDWPRLQSLMLIAPFLLAMAVIFVMDTITDYAIAAAVFYTTVILVATRLLSARAVVVLACSCVLLTLVSFAFTRSGVYEVGLVNTAISIVAIGVTTYLALRLVAAEATAYETRERLLRIARVTSLGELTASIAHEINQPLTAIVTSAGACTRWLAQQPPSLDNARRAIDRIVQEANRSSEVIARIRGFTSGKEPQRSAFDLNDAIGEIVSLARSQIDHHEIALTLELQPSLPAVLADKVQIEQVVGNLLLNAIEAMMTSANKVRRLQIVSSTSDTGAVRCSIADSGVGFRQGEVDHLFDAFWTTKADGIGLGLTISRSIIEANGGRIWAEANQPSGAVLLFELPSVKRETE